MSIVVKIIERRWNVEILERRSGWRRFRKRKRE